MPLTVTVTRGTTLPSGRPVTLAALRLLGLPSVSITGLISAGDIAPGAITPAAVTPGAYAFAIASGGGAAYALTLNPALTGFGNGVQVWWKAPTGTGGDCAAGATLNVNTLGAKGLYWHGQAVRAGDILGDDLVLVVYNTSRNSGAGGWDILGTVNNDGFRLATTAGTANAQTAAFLPPVRALAAIRGIPFAITIGTGLTNTSATVTLAIDGLAATNLKSPGGGNLLVGDLLEGVTYFCTYDGTNILVLARAHPDQEYLETDTGAANAYAFAPSPAYKAYAELKGRLLHIKAANQNTGTSTLQISGLATPPTLKFSGRNLISREIPASRPVAVMHDGTDVQLLTPPAVGLARAWCSFVGTNTQQKTINNTPTGNNLTVTGHGLGATPPTTLDAVQLVSFAQGGSLPGGLSVNTAYYARPSDANTITLHTTAQGAIDNTNVVSLGGGGAGTNSLTYILNSDITGYNIQGVRHQTSGGSTVTADFTFYFRQPFSSAFYAAALTAYDGANNLVPTINSAAVQTVNIFRIDIRDFAANPHNPSVCNAMFFGLQ